MSFFYQEYEYSCVLCLYNERHLLYSLSKSWLAIKGTYWFIFFSDENVVFFIFFLYFPISLFTCWRLLPKQRHSWLWQEKWLSMTVSALLLSEILLLLLCESQVVTCWWWSCETLTECWPQLTESIVVMSLRPLNTTSYSCLSSTRPRNIASI